MGEAKMQTSKIISLFKTYLAAFKDYDLGKVATCYHLPCTLHTPDKVVLLKDSKSCRQEFDDIFKQLQQAKTSDIIARKSSYSLITDNLLFASVDWEFIDDQGEIFADFCAIYHLIIIDDKLKIINVVSHDLSNSLLLDYPFELIG
jgi:hypothetical protein